MTPTNDVASVEGAPIKVAPDGTKYIAGQFSFSATPEFNTGRLRQINPRIVLVQEYEFHDGTRHLFATAPDHEIEAILVALEKEPHVSYPARNFPVELL